MEQIKCDKTEAVYADEAPAAHATDALGGQIRTSASENVAGGSGLEDVSLAEASEPSQVRSPFSALCPTLAQTLSSSKKLLDVIGCCCCLVGTLASSCGLRARQSRL